MQLAIYGLSIAGSTPANSYEPSLSSSLAVDFSPSQAQRPRTATTETTTMTTHNDLLSIAGSTPANSYHQGAQGGIALFDLSIAGSTPANSYRFYTMSGTRRTKRSPSQAQRPRTATQRSNRKPETYNPLSIAGSTPANSYAPIDTFLATIVSLHRRLNAREQLPAWVFVIFRTENDLSIAGSTPANSYHPYERVRTGDLGGLSIAGSTPANSYLAPAE